jgi:hypothetical protein
MDTSLVEAVEPSNVTEPGTNLLLQALILSFQFIYLIRQLVRVPQRSKMLVMDYRMTRDILHDSLLTLRKLKCF